MKHFGQESKLRIPIKNKEIVNVRSSNFLGAIIENDMSWVVHTESTYIRIG
jgi:hypothetical protein